MIPILKASNALYDEVYVDAEKLKIFIDRHRKVTTIICKGEEFRVGMEFQEVTRKLYCDA